MNLFLPVIATAAWATTEAQLWPETVAPGQAATLTIRTDTGARPRWNPPAGLQVRGTGQSTQIQFINGIVQQQTTYTFQLVATDTGTYTVGPIQVGPDQAGPMTLRVTPNAGPVPQARNPWGPPPRRSPAPPNATKPGKRAFARIWVEDATPVVGQAVPLTVSAYLRNDVGGTLEAAPSIDSPDFIIDGLDEEPTHTETEIDGVGYTRFTWTASLTPVRTGTSTLHTSIPATIQWVEHVPSSRRSLLEEMLANDPFFRNSGIARMMRGLGGMGVEPQVRSAHVDLEASRTITVEAPPTEGRPDTFTGAVGAFTLRLEEAPAEAQVGEPVEFVWVVEGKGNFDALDMAGIPDGDGWDSYPVERAFTPTVKSRTKGTLRFTQLVVPREPGELKLPPLVFAWFDPVENRYEEARLDLPTLRVEGVGTTAVASSTTTQESATRDVRRNRLLPPEARTGIWAAPAVLWALLVGFVLTGDRPAHLLAGARARGAHLWRRRRLRRQILQAAARGDADTMFRDGLTLIEHDGLDRSSDPVRTFVETAERALYGRQLPDPDALPSIAAALLAAEPTPEAA